MTKVEMIRAVKQMQTQVLVQRSALFGMCSTLGHETSKVSHDLSEVTCVELMVNCENATVAVDHYIAALQHVVDELVKSEKATDLPGQPAGHEAGP